MIESMSVMCVCMESKAARRNLAVSLCKHALFGTQKLFARRSGRVYGINRLDRILLH
jgi:hypothetical protein